MNLAALALFLIGTASAQVISQTPSTNALTVTTNANLTGDVTSVGNEATVVKASGNSFSVGVTTFAVVGGLVGIGTTTIDAMLHVHQINASLGATVRMTNNGTNINSILFAQTYNTTPNYAVIGQGTDGSLVLGGGSSIASGHVFITDAGGVGIATMSVSTEKLNVVGSIRQSNTLNCSTGIQVGVTGILTGCVASDISLKERVLTLPYDPTAIDRLRPVLYHWKKTANRDSKQHVGFIAQEFEKVSPQAVVPAGENLKGIDASSESAIIVRELQELRKRVAALEAKK